MFSSVLRLSTQSLHATLLITSAESVPGISSLHRGFVAHELGAFFAAFQHSLKTFLNIMSNGGQLLFDIFYSGLSSPVNMMARVFEEAQETAYQSSPFEQRSEPERAWPTPVVPANPR